MMEVVATNTEVSVVRYATVQTEIWRNPDFRALPKDLRILFLYLLTSEHSNMIGYYYLPLAYIHHDTQFSIEMVPAMLRELCEREKVAYDFNREVVLLKRYLHWNPVRGENMIKGALGAAKGVPKGVLLGDFVKCAKKFCPDYKARWDGLLTGNEPPPNPLATPSEPPPNTEPVTVPVTVPVTDISSPKRKRVEYPPEFEEFWNVYPRTKQVPKKDALKAWNARLKDEGVTSDRLITAAKNYADTCRRRGTSEDYTMYPSTFLGPNEKWLPYEELVAVVKNDFIPITEDETTLLLRRLAKEGKLEH